MKKFLIIGCFSLILAGCGNSATTAGGTTPPATTIGTQTAVYTAVNALTAADDVALAYTTLPTCGGVNKPPLCSNPKIKAQIKVYAQKAHDAVKAAELGGGDASLAAANAAITLFVNNTPKVPATN